MMIFHSHAIKTVLENIECIQTTMKHLLSEFFLVTTGFFLETKSIILIFQFPNIFQSLVFWHCLKSIKHWLDIWSCYQIFLKANRRDRRSYIFVLSWSRYILQELLELNATRNLIMWLNCGEHASVTQYMYIYIYVYIHTYIYIILYIYIYIYIYI